MTRTEAKLGARLRAQFGSSPKKTIVLVALLPLLVLVWIPLLRGKGQPAPPAAVATGAPIPTPAPLGETLAPAESSDVPSLDFAELGERVERARKTFRPRWAATAERDPFAAAAAGAVGSSPAAAALDADMQRLAPSSVFLSATQPPIAVIQGRSYRTGDKIQGVLIVGIEERRVLLKRGGTVFAVSIPQPTAGAKHATAGAKHD